MSRLIPAVLAAAPALADLIPTGAAAMLSGIATPPINVTSNNVAGSAGIANGDAVWGIMAYMET